MRWVFILLLYYLPLVLSQSIFEKRQGTLKKASSSSQDYGCLDDVASCPSVASQSCASRDQTVGVCSPSTTDVWYNNTYHELTWKYNNPVFNGFETLTFHLLQQNGTNSYQQIKSFDVVHAVGVQVVLIDNTWYPSLLPDNSPNVTRIVYAYLIGSGVDLQQELDNPLSLYPRPSQFTLIQNSLNTTSSTSTNTALSPSSSSTTSSAESTTQNNQNSPSLPVWAIVIIVIAAVVIIIAAIVLTWLIRNIRRNRQRDHQPLNKNDTDHDEALENMTPIIGNTSTIVGATATPKSTGLMMNNNNNNNTDSNINNNNNNNNNNTVNKILGPNFNHIDTNDLSSSIHSSTPMMHGSMRGSPTVPSPSSIDRPPSITATVNSPNAGLHHLQHEHQPASSILSSTDALMIADTFRQFMRKPDWSDPPAASDDLPDDDHHHYDDETDEQKRMRVGNELLQKQLAEEGTTMKDIERR